MTAEERFWAKVEKTGDCWLWRGNQAGGGGYGTFYPDARRGPGRTRVSAHRFSWEMAFGPVTGGLWVLHRCDVPACVNPAHLFLGTHDDNMADRKRKGRYAGAGRHFTKLTADQAKEIRALMLSGAHRPTVAERFGVHQDTVRLIEKGRTWTCSR